MTEKTFTAFMIVIALLVVALASMGCLGQDQTGADAQSGNANAQDSGSQVAQATGTAGSAGADMPPDFGGGMPPDGAGPGGDFVPPN